MVDSSRDSLSSSILGYNLATGDKVIRVRTGQLYAGVRYYDV